MIALRLKTGALQKNGPQTKQGLLQGSKISGQLF